MHTPLYEWNGDERASSAPIVILIMIAIALGGIFYLLAGSGGLSLTVGTTAGIIVIILVIGAAMSLILYLAWHFSPANKLRQALRRIAPLVDYELSETVKPLYLDAYNLYLKLSEQKRANFYTRINSLRERIEEHLKNEKEMEQLFQEASKGSLSEQKQRYLAMYQVYEKLPAKVQHEYYPRIVQLRDRLERGN